MLKIGSLAANGVWEEGTPATFHSNGNSGLNSVVSKSLGWPIRSNSLCSKRFDLGGMTGFAPCFSAKAMNRSAS